MKIAIIGDYASQNYLIGKELESCEFEITYFLQSNIYSQLPLNYHKLGSVQGPLIKNYVNTGFWIFFGKFLRKYDIQQINGTYPNCVRSKYTSYHYHGSEIRLDAVKPRYPSFVSLRELLKFSDKSIFLPRCADHNFFIPNKEVKEEKEKFKNEKGYDYVIGHFAPSPTVKGSSLVEQSIEQINKENEYSIHFINQSYPREKMPEIINFCDLVVDHVNPSMGSTYNVITIESLFCEVPTACYYNENIDFEEMKSYVGFLDSKPEEMKDNLLALLKDNKEIDREKILKFHHPRMVTDKLLLTWDDWGFTLTT
ncbi:MAG: hypothetical protein H7645_02870 [Candidatus Heimdallarchaeota archaeon]|nr:hypothetical protein [Candidatus Heimdallarchaeota archaeon]MCK4769258.1 hypothetical protein [Candidatus Heimdallarchaeota archaeon]